MRTFYFKLYIFFWVGITSVKSIVLNPSIPATFPISESEQSTRELPVDCNGILTIESKSPSSCSLCFGIIPKGGGVSTLFYAQRNGQKLDYDQAQSYTFNMACSDGTNGMVILQVIPNFPPRFQNTATSQTINPSTAANGVVMDLNPFDAENDRLSYTVTDNTNNGFFDIDIMGRIIADKPLNTFCKSETVTVTMTDGVNQPVTKTVTMDPGTNTKPVLKDWNRIITVPENEPLDLLITDFLAPAGTCTITLSQPEYDNYIDSSRCPQGSASRITSAGGNTFNFEEDPPINITLLYDNGNCPSDPRWLFVQWSDEQEPPILTLDKMDYVEKEGFITIKPQYGITDDQGDTHTYSFVDPNVVNPNFRIDSVTGRIYTPEFYNKDCIEDRKGFIFDVQVTDQAGNAAVDPVKVKLNITDINDKRPYFTRRFDNTAVPYADCIRPFVFADYSTDTADDDCEEATNKAVEFIPATSGSLSLSKDGVVRLTKPPIDGQVDTLTIQLTDKGEPPLLSEPETVSITGFPCPTTAPPVEPVVPDDTDDSSDSDTNINNGISNGGNTNGGVVTEAGFFDNPWNYALVALGGLLGLLLLGLLAYLLYRCCKSLCGNACYKLRTRPLKPNTVKPGKLSGDGKGKGANKGAEDGVAEGESVEAPTGQMVGGKIIRYGGYVDEYGYAYDGGGAEGGGYGYGEGGGYGYENGGYGQGMGEVVGDTDSGRVDDGYWKEHFQDKDFTNTPSRKSLPATVDKD